MLLQRVTVLAVACQQWTQQANTNYANGQGNLAASVQLCQTACIANTACNGFDWVPTAAVGQQCWLSGTWSGARDTMQGITHYVLNRQCPRKVQHFNLSSIYIGIS